ncbi:MAG: hypothetical protein AAGF66_10520 [Cyanobacteria bacterium P01_H01_bin.119]
MAGVPIVLVTSKTRAEVDTLRQQMGLTDPFIVENGSAVFFPGKNLPFELPEEEDLERDCRLLLGCQSIVVRAKTEGDRANPGPTA